VSQDAIAISMRRARREDLPAIVAMMADDHLGRDRELATDPLPDCYLRAFEAIDRDPRNLLAVAEGADGEVLGCMQLTFIPTIGHQGAERVLIEGVRVEGRLRGQGVGRRMLRWAIEEAKRRGCKTMRLSTHASRVDAQRFYKSLGFADSHVGMALAL
jgi:ribosomal protein S18 acetylase RimI-like enzyme